MEDLIFKLCSTIGISGNEYNTSQLVLNELKKYAQVSCDHNGNVTAVIGKGDNGKHIMLDAHIDQIGLIVTFIDDNGFIKVAPCGGVDRRIMLGSTVMLANNQDVHGIVCCMPPHLSNGGDDSITSIDKMYIDFGMSKDEISKIVSVGDYITICSNPKKLISDYISAPALDNRAGIASLIRCAQILYEQNINCKLTILLSSQEETGEIGAKTCSYTINPDECIVVDVSFGAQPSVPTEKCGKLGDGPMIGIAPSLCGNIYNKLIDIAKNNNIPYQIEVMNGQTGTNADVISTTRGGVKTGLISIPLRYMHTPVEIININDIENTAKLIALYVKDGGVY